MAEESVERAAFEAHVKADLKSNWLYNNPDGHRLVDSMVKVIPAEINGHKQNRAGQYLTQWVETMWKGWWDRASIGDTPAPQSTEGGEGVALGAAVQPKNDDDALLIDNLFRAMLGGDSIAIDTARMALRQRMNELRNAGVGVGVNPSAGEPS